MWRNESGIGPVRLELKVGVFDFDKLKVREDDLRSLDVQREE